MLPYIVRIGNLDVHFSAPEMEEAKVSDRTLDHIEVRKFTRYEEESVSDFHSRVLGTIRKF